MDEKKEGIASVPYIVYESAQTRMERTNKRLLIALILAIVLIFASNAVWLYAWMQYDYYSGEETKIDVDAKEGTANYIGNDGSIINGQDTSDQKEIPAP